MNTELLDIFAEYATDEALENNGTIFPLGKGASLLVARAGNRRYSRAISAAVDLKRVELDAGPNATDAALDAAAAVSDEIFVDVMAETILLGWDKLAFKGEVLPYSVDNAKKMLRVKDFRKLVASLSERVDAFKVKAEVEAGKT
jgi:hypothetical protein